MLYVQVEVDLSGDGFVDREEFERVMKDKGTQLNQDQIDVFSKQFELDGNSRVTYERRLILFRVGKHAID